MLGNTTLSSCHTAQHTDLHMHGCTPQAHTGFDVKPQKPAQIVHAAMWLCLSVNSSQLSAPLLANLSLVSTTACRSCPGTVWSVVCYKKPLWIPLSAPCLGVVRAFMNECMRWVINKVFFLVLINEWRKPTDTSNNWCQFEWSHRIWEKKSECIHKRCSASCLSRLRQKGFWLEPKLPSVIGPQGVSIPNLLRTNQLWGRSGCNSSYNSTGKWFSIKTQFE